MSSVSSIKGRIKSIWQLILVFSITVKAFTTVKIIQSSIHANERHRIFLKSTDVAQKVGIDDKTDRFLEWTVKEGIKAPKCEVFMFPGGLRGLRALEDIADGEVFLQVPLRLCFTSDAHIMEKLNTGTKDAVHEDCTDNDDDENIPIVASASDAFQWPVRLAIRIITESRSTNNEGKGSIWSTYIATLPQPPTADKSNKIQSKNPNDMDCLASTLPVHWDDVSYQRKYFN